jgi:hypothetical protein
MMTTTTTTMTTMMLTTTMMMMIMIAYLRSGSECMRMRSVKLGGRFSPSKLLSWS